MKAKLITRTLQSVAPRSKAYDIRDTELPGFLLRVSPSGTLVYFCDLRRPDGRRTRIKIGNAKVLTPTQARDEAYKVLGSLAQGQDPVASRKLAHQETLKTFISKHYGSWVLEHRKSGAETIQKTLACFSEFKDQRLSEISPWKIEKWRSARLKNGITASTINRNIGMLKSILSKAVEWGVITTHPLSKVRPLKLDPSSKIRFLNEEEEVALRRALDFREERNREERRSHNEWLIQRNLELYPDLDQVHFTDHLKPMVLISINTGIRRGELFNLNWDDIDFRQQLLTVIGATAKSGKTRHIPLNKEALLTFQLWKAQCDRNHGLIFVSKTGDRFNNIKKSWQGLLKEARIINFRWHDLRHHFASKLVMKSVDLNTVRELLGHGDLKMTLRYAHLAPQVKADAVAKLDWLPPAPIALHKNASLGG